jgi:hypothetical protein
MSLGVFTSWAVARAVDVVNLFGERGDEVTRADLHALLRNYGFEEDDFDVGDFARLARDLRGAFLDTDHDVRIRRINHLLYRFQPIPRLAEHGDQATHFHYVVDGPPVEHVGASFLMAIANTIVDSGEERFGWCAAPKCDRLFFDRSRNRSQRFCSRSCATRVHVRAHRARQ